MSNHISSVVNLGVDKATMFNTERIVTKENLPALFGRDMFPLWEKRDPVRAVRVESPFTVQTSEGVVRCEDGYLAIDSRGYPYPIAKDEFEAIYVRVPGWRKVVE